MLVRLMIDKFDSVAYCTTGAWRRKLWYVGRDFRPRFHYAYVYSTNLLLFTSSPLLSPWYYLSSTHNFCNIYHHSKSYTTTYSQIFYTVFFSFFLFFDPFRALALLSLYPQADPLILGWFPEVVNIAQDVLCEEEHSLVEDAEDFRPSSRRDLDGEC